MRNILRILLFCIGLGLFGLGVSAIPGGPISNNPIKYNFDKTIYSTTGTFNLDQRLLNQHWKISYDLSRGSYNQWNLMESRMFQQNLLNNQMRTNDLNNKWNLWDANQKMVQEQLRAEDQKNKWNLWETGQKIIDFQNRLRYDNLNNNMKINDMMYRNSLLQQNLNNIYRQPTMIRSPMINTFGH